MGYPAVRMRRLRRTSALRRIMQKVNVSPTDLICPVFVDEHARAPVPIKFMPGYSRLPIRGVVEEVKHIVEQGVKAVILFVIPSNKDEKGSTAYAANGIIQKAVHGLKKEFGNELAVITDVCLCEYTSHGHCGVVNDDEIQNDPTLEILQKVAVSHAQAGSDIVAPSGMMDGQVKSIREALDDGGVNQES